MCMFPFDRYRYGVSRGGDAIRSNFDTGVIFYVDRLADFLKIFSASRPALHRNGVEIIVFLAEPASEAALMVYISQFPFVNWKVLTSLQVSGSKFYQLVRCFSYVSKKYVLLADAAYIFTDEILYRLRYMIEHYSHSFIILYEPDFVSAFPHPKEMLAGYSAIMVERRHGLSVADFSGDFFDESVCHGFIGRLGYLGLKRMTLYAERPHGQREPGYIPAWRQVFEGLTHKGMKRALYPSLCCHTGEGVAKQLSLRYDYSDSGRTRWLCERYLCEFEQYAICRSDVFEARHDIVVLIQTYNERRHIDGWFRNIGNQCDGIVLLDDGSDDDTYHAATSNQLLLKVRKIREGFNDLRNRNILLNIASFIRSKWFVFIDADERLDKRYGDLRSLIARDPETGSIGFWIANLWGDETRYKPDPSQSQNQGLWIRMRMFRNIGHMQIGHTGKHLHFTCVPYIDRPSAENILLLHLGTLDRRARQHKYDFYKNEDPDWDYNRQANYDFLINDDHDVLSVERIQLPGSIPLY